MSVEMRKVGKVKDAHGIKGEIYLIVFSGDTSWVGDLKTVHLETKKGPIVLTPIKTRIHKEGFILTSKEVTDRNQSEALKGAELLVPADIFSTDEDEEGFYLLEIENFAVSDSHYGDLGIIVGFSSNGAQDLILVKSKGGFTYEIPLVDEFIVKMDYDAHQLLMKLPEGLLETQNEELEEK